MGKPNPSLHDYNDRWTAKYRCPAQGGVNRRFGKHRSINLDTGTKKKNG